MEDGVKQIMLEQTLNMFNTTFAKEKVDKVILKHEHSVHRHQSIGAKSNGALWRDTR